MGCSAHGGEGSLTGRGATYDYAGTATWSAAGPGELYVVRGRHDASATVELGGGSPLTSVRRTPPGGAAATCADHNRFAPASLSAGIRRGRLSVSLGDAGPPLLGARCAGPVADDLAAAMPRAEVALAALRSGHGSLSLAGTRPFRSRDFVGTVTATITLRIGRLHRLHSPRPPGADRSLTTVYRVRALTGSATATVTTAPSARGCARLDACGAHGTLRLVPGHLRGGTVRLVASAGHRVPERQLRAALGLSGGGQGDVSVDGGGALPSRGTLSAAIAQPSAACRDHVAIPYEWLSVATTVGGRLIATLAPAGRQAPDALRTRCPGPIVAGFTLARATLPRSVLRHRRFTVVLRADELPYPPYVLRNETKLRLTLERVAVRRGAHVGPIAQDRAIDAGSTRSRRVMVTLACRVACAAPR